MADRFSTDDMLDVYLFENQQLLEKLECTVLEQKDEDVFNDEIINEIFRTIHTIKGSSGVMMFDDITTVSHKLEDIFYVMRENRPENVPHLRLVEYVLKVVDFIKGELDKIQHGEAADGDFSDIIADLDAFLEEIKARVKDAPKKPEEKVQTSPQRYYIAPVVAKEDNDVPIFIDLESSVEEIEARAELLQKQREEEEKAAKERFIVPGDFVVESREPGKGVTLAMDKSKGFESATYINVEIAKMDQLMELTEKMMELDAVTQMKEIATKMQSVIISMRRIPLFSTFRKMNRVVFELSRKLGKDVDLVMEGEMTEVDKRIVEHISDPLMHLVRNAVDHGIESREEKIQAGKTQRSKVTLSAKIESEYLLIVVEDNGKGLDRDRILEKARCRGLLEEEKTDRVYTDKEVFSFITLPGFSTKESVTEYSGRGVGLDVVLSDIAEIGGTLEIESEKDKGCKMIMKIPLA